MKQQKIDPVLGSRDARVLLRLMQQKCRKKGGARS